MKKFASPLALAVVLTLTALAPAWGMDLSQGFLGQEWGKNIAEAEGFTKLRTAGIIDYYKNENITYKFSDIEAAMVVFGAIQGELFAVFVGLETEQGFTRMQDYLSSKFGMPKVKDQVDFQEHTWTVYDSKVRIKLKKEMNNGEMKLAIYYMPLSKPDTPAFNRSIDEFPSYKWDDSRMPPSAIPILSF